MEISNSYRYKLIRWHNIADLFFNRFRFIGSRKFYRKVSKLFLPKLKSKIFCPTVFGFDLVVGPENARDYYYLGFYETGALNIIKNLLKEGDIVLDVGANIGLISFYSSLFVGDKGRVIAFEPTKKYFDDLNAGISKNNFKNILPLNIGLGNIRQKLPIYHNSVCPSMIKTSESDDVEMIQIESLDQVMRDLNIKKIHLLKIDVEGFECEVLKGGLNLISFENAPVICIEYVKHFQKKGLNYLMPLEIIKQCNSYRFFQLEKSSQSISKLIEIKNLNELHENDNVFCFLDEHINEYKHLFEK